MSPAAQKETQLHSSRWFITSPFCAVALLPSNPCQVHMQAETASIFILQLLLYDAFASELWSALRSAMAKKHDQWKILHICSYHWCSLKIILSHHACRALAIIVTALGKKDKDRFGQKENFLPNGWVDGGLKSQKKHLTPSQIFSARRFGCPTSLNSYISNAHAMMQ